MSEASTVHIHDGTCERSHRRSTEATSTTCEAQLLEAVRRGDNEAFAMIYARHHDVVERLARRLCRDRHEADDVVSEVFCKTLRAIGHGHGPRDDARPYLLRSVRHTVTSMRSCKDTGRTTPMATIDDRGVEDPLAVGGPATEAWLGVADRFRDVLWSVEVQGFDTGDIACAQSIDAPAAASLVHRARHALKRSYLRGAITAPTTDERCRPVRSLLVAYAQDNVSATNRSRIVAHLDHCTLCGTALREVHDAQRRLTARSWIVLAPAFFRAFAIDAGHVLLGAGAAVPLAVVGVSAGGLLLTASAIPAAETSAGQVAAPLIAPASTDGETSPADDRSGSADAGDRRPSSEPVPPAPTSVERSDVAFDEAIAAATAASDLAPITPGSAGVVDHASDPGLPTAPPAIDVTHVLDPALDVVAGVSGGLGRGVDRIVDATIDTVTATVEGTVGTVTDSNVVEAVSGALPVVGTVVAPVVDIVETVGGAPRDLADDLDSVVPTVDGVLRNLFRSGG